MVLEVFSLCLTRGDCAENPHLVYTLLYQKEAFAPFCLEPHSATPALAEPLARLEALQAFFAAPMEGLTTYEEIIGMVEDQAPRPLRRRPSPSVEPWLLTPNRPRTAPRRTS